MQTQCVEIKFIKFYLKEPRICGESESSYKSLFTIYHLLVIILVNVTNVNVTNCRDVGDGDDSDELPTVQQEQSTIAALATYDEEDDHTIIIIGS